MKTCSQCAAIYEEEAQFCRACGSSLEAPARPGSPVSGNKGSSRQEEVPLELRAQLGGSSSKLWGTLAVVACLFVGGFSWLLGRSRTLPANRPQYASSMTTSETPASDSGNNSGAIYRFTDCTASASSFIHSKQGNRYDPQRVLDGMRETAWNAENTRHGVGEWIQLSWPSEREVSRIGAIVGYDKHSQLAKYKDDPWMWNRNNRVKSATLVFSNGSRTQVSFDDSTIMQYRDFTPVRTSWVRFVVDDVYLDKYQGKDKNWDDICISELQVLGKM